MTSPVDNSFPFLWSGQMESHSNDSTDAELMQALLENQSLKEQIAMQTQFMHLLTHQLATPLTSLSGSIHLLAEASLEPEQQQEFLAVVQHQVQRLESLLQDLISIRDLETGNIETHADRIHLPELVKEVVAGFRPYPVAYQFSSDFPLIWGDRWQISQVIVNLLSNAIKYSPDGRPIEIGAALQTQGWVQAWVRDHGLGIPTADQPHLFERFYRVKHTDRQNIEGTGLGLALCKLLIENQSGQLWFESQHGQGSCFFFTLPALKE